MSFCKDCFTGVRLEGTPEGKFENVGGIHSYVVTPTAEYPTDAVIIFLTDIFGVALSNNQLLADDFAKNGFKVVMPDLFKGDQVPEEALFDGPAPFNVMEWLPKHTNAITKPMVDTVMEALKEEGVTKFAFTGYCYGGRIAFDLAFEGKGQAIAVAHPSHLTFPDDIEKFKSTSKTPLLINSCTTDTQFPLEILSKVDEIMSGFDPGYRREHFEGCTHGFAVRGDMSDPKVKAGKEGAFKATVLWFREHLK